ncbi:hypothetical protein ANO11243_031540 [Dothideomycetidae sp. 11243]|nr:hypothetical protein ANO11243_031540 [fungal sp. No.11243]
MARTGSCRVRLDSTAAAKVLAFRPGPIASARPRVPKMPDRASFGRLLCGWPVYCAFGYILDILFVAADADADAEKCWSRHKEFGHRLTNPAFLSGRRCASLGRRKTAACGLHPRKANMRLIPSFHSLLFAAAAANARATHLFSTMRAPIPSITPLLGPFSNRTRVCMAPTRMSSQSSTQ